MGVALVACSVAPSSPVDDELYTPTSESPTATSSVSVHVPSEWGTGFEDPCIQRYFSSRTSPDIGYTPSAEETAECAPLDQDLIRVVSRGLRWLGTEYSWSGGDLSGPTEGFDEGEGVTGFDCSSFTRYVWNFGGIVLPRTARQQWDVRGERVTTLDDLEPGDLVILAYDTSDPDTIYHVSIYLGDDAILESSTGWNNVHILSEISSYPVYQTNFIGGLRLDRTA